MSDQEYEYLTVSDVQMAAAFYFQGKAAWTSLLNLQKQLGELTRAYLKLTSVPCLDEERWKKEARSGAADVAIGLAHFCETFGLDLEECVKEKLQEIGDDQ